MHESYTHQSLPEKAYRELLGTALCAFNSNNGFIIENILRYDDEKEFNWRSLIDLESGMLKASIEKTISKKYGDGVKALFSELVIKRNRIIHSFRITDEENRQILATQIPLRFGGGQFHITEEYLIDFIKQNDRLSSMLHDVRGF